MSGVRPGLEYAVRHVRVAPGLVLAPMEGVTDITFRRLIRGIGGCGLTVTEFIPARNLRMSVQQALDAAMFDPDERPIAIQIYGRDPEIMADGARLVEDLGADVLDLNMGCPSKKVCSNSGGSALMKEPDQARAIVQAMRAATSLPFTVKMRAGWDPAHRNAPEIARMCEGEGVEALAVHWRTRADLYGGVRELDTLAAVKAAVSIPVLANGDIVDAASALDTLAATGADGLMIGRGAIRDPWVFRKVDAAIRGLPEPSVDLAERRRVLLGYLEAIRPRMRDARATLGRFKKISRYFTEGVPGGESLRVGVLHASTLDEAIERVNGFFDAEPALA